MPQNESGFAVRFDPGAGGDANPTYFDDLRLFPAQASLNSYVYDRADLRLAATLDENNFAVLYAYHDDGTLYLVRRETERGLKTVRETHAHLRERPSVP